MDRKPGGNRKRIRLSIKLATFTTLMVVISMLASSYYARGSLDPRVTGWVLGSSVVSLVVGLLYTLFLDRVITLPLQRLVEYTSSMVSQDFQTPAPLESNDEIGTLAGSMDELRRSFLAQRRSLTELNERLDAMVALRTHELELALDHLKATQEELLRVEKLASIGRLAGGIAHEINNPAGIILTRASLLIELAREDGLDDDFIESLQVIERQVSRIAGITRDLLIFSRRAPREVTRVDVGEVLSQCHRLYGPRAKELQIRLPTRLPRGCLVRADASALEQVFTNLIKNAFDAMEEQGGAIEYEWQVTDGRLRLALRDHGSGIPEEALPHIFDPFYTTKKIGKGTGLGLAISYGILQELGGTLEAFNHPEGGACFEVGLRMADDLQAIGKCEEMPSASEVRGEIRQDGA